MKLTMLGTGNALVTECYNTCFVIEDENKYFLVDGGGGNAILSQLKLVNVDWKNIKDIFVTHKHIDHIGGIIWLVRMICQHMKQGQYDGDARIYAHSDLLKIINDVSCLLLQESSTKFLGKRLHLIPVSDGETRNIIGHDITFFDIHSTKAKQFGFTFTYGDNKKLTCCGDEPCNDTIKNYVKNSDWLLHEAFCLYSETDIFKPYEKNHSTVKDACELATSLNVKNLVLYHTEDKNIKERKVLYKNEGTRYYNGNLFVPDDLEAFSIL